MTLTPRRRCLLVTFDAFETLFHPRRPIPESYAAVARAYGLNGPAVAPTTLQSAFKKAYKAQSRQFPNYGRNMVLRGEYGGPKQWWTGVIEATFANALDQPHSQLPEGMVDTLIETFASQQGYSLYEDVQSCFDKLKNYKTRQSQFECVVTGIVSNSDDRVPTVLESLGLSVGGTRADQDRSSTLLPGFEGDPVVANPQTNQNINSSDLNMIITSYEAGEEKPDQLIYDVAARQADRLLRSIKPAAGTSDKIEWLRIHVGDDFEKDFQGAKSAGWHGILLDRDREFTGNLRDMEIIHSLEALLPLLERYATS